jgi:hypothetical protein
MPHEAPQRLEPPDVDVVSTLRFVFGFFAFVAVSIGLLGVYYHLAFEHPRETMAQFPAPKLETREAEGRKGLAGPLSEIGAYAWVDRSRGVVRIPVARAMEIIAGRGSHAFDPLSDAAASDGAHP